MLGNRVEISHVESGPSVWTTPRHMYGERFVSAVDRKIAVAVGHAAFWVRWSQSQTRHRFRVNNVRIQIGMLVTMVRTYPLASSMQAGVCREGLTGVFHAQQVLNWISSAPQLARIMVNLALLKTLRSQSPTCPAKKTRVLLPNIINRMAIVCGRTSVESVSEARRTCMMIECIEAGPALR